MKTIPAILGIVLILLGVFSLGYEGFYYTTREKVAEIGDIKVTADKEKFFHIPPVLGGAALIAGIALVAIGRKKG